MWVKYKMVSIKGAEMKKIVAVCDFLETLSLSQRGELLKLLRAFGSIELEVTTANLPNSPFI